MSLAGRLVSKRVMGKASFAHILDGDGQIQLYFKRDVLGDEPYAEFKNTTSAISSALPAKFS